MYVPLHCTCTVRCTGCHPWLLISDLSSFKCLIIIKICFACQIAFAKHHPRRLTLDDFFTDQIFITVSPPVMNLGPFSEPIKASIAYIYQIFDFRHPPDGRLTFPPFDTLLYHIGVCTSSWTFTLIKSTQIFKIFLKHSHWQRQCKYPRELDMMESDHRYLRIREASYHWKNVQYLFLKPVTGIEPVSTAWKAAMLILYTTRTYKVFR